MKIFLSRHRPPVHGMNKRLLELIVTANHNQKFMVIIGSHALKTEMRLVWLGLGNVVRGK